VKYKNPKHVHAFTDRLGKARYYFRFPGRRAVSLPGLPYSREFMEAYHRALEEDWVAPPTGVARTKPGTVNAALVSYYGSAAFAALAVATRQNRRAILERFREDYGDKAVATMNKRALQAILGKKSPVVAKNWSKALRGLIDHAMALDMIENDPLAGIRLTPVKTHGHHAWEPQECARFEAHHAVGTRARLAYELLLQAGQSKCDVVRMGRQHVHDGTLSLRRQKTDVPFDVPVLPALQEAISAMPTSDHLTFLVTAHGKPFTAAGFGNWFRQICDEAGLPKRCTSHGLRKAAATRLADRSGTTTQLMAWFGWKSSSEAERYTKSADRKKAAAAAGRLITGTELRKPETNQLQTFNKSLKTKENNK
jgi:integrase